MLKENYCQLGIQYQGKRSVMKKKKKKKAVSRQTKTEIIYYQQDYTKKINFKCGKKKRDKYVDTYKYILLVIILILLWI